MARKLSWSPEAVEDVQAIASYIERDSAWYAQVVVEKIMTVAEAISDFPEIGRMVPEIGNSEIRERFVHSYRLIYRVDRDAILLAAVIHGSRLLGPFAQRIAGSEI